MLPDAFVEPTVPELTISPATRDYGDVTVGSESMAADFTVENTGTGASAALSAQLMGAGAADFVITANECAGMRLAAGDSCTVSVSYAPSAASRSSATLQVGDSDVSASASLNGRGIGEGLLTITPTPVTFPTTTVGETSAARTFTVRNTGGSATGALSPMLGGADPMHFRIAADTCTGMTLAAAATCTIDVEYTPMGAAAHSATLEVSGSPGGTTSAAMSGTGVNPTALRISPMMQDFGSSIVGTAGTPITFNVINGGGVATGTLTTALTGASAAEFSITSDTCSGGTLAGGATCSIAVRFTAASAGAKTASLDVGDGTLSVSSALSAMGTAVGSITLEPPSNDFLTSSIGVATGATTFTLRNTGGSDTGAITTAIAGANPGDFRIVSDGCAASVLPAGGTCTIAVDFNPTAAGARSATLRAVASPGGTATSALMGTGESPAVIDVTPTSQNFGSIATGATSTTVNFTVRNTGGSTSGVPTVALIGVQATEFNLVANTCTAAIPGGGMCTVSVRFAPTSLGSKTAQLEVTATPGGRDVSDISGTGITPAQLVATAGSSPRDFNSGGAITPETMSFTAMATIRNDGAETSGALTTMITDTDGMSAAGFSVTGCSGMMLTGDPDGTGPLAGATCAMTITFAPTAQRTYTANLVVTGLPGGTVTIPLSGIGTPDIEIRPLGAMPSVYPDTRVGMTSSITWEVVNRTTTARTYTAQAFTGTDAAQFTRTGGTCVAAFALGAAASPGAAGGTCTIIVQFAPTGTAGGRTASLDVTTSGGGAESRALTGNAAGPVRFLGWRLLAAGSNPAITACPTGSATTGLNTTFPATFSTAASPFQVGSATPNLQICVRNENTTTPAGDSGVLTTTDTLPADMRVVANDCNGQNLIGGTAAASQCSVVVRWFPNSAETVSGPVNLAYGANSTSATVSGVSVTSLAVTMPSPVNFGSTTARVTATDTSTNTVVITNPGTVDAAITNTTITGAATGAAWAITGNTCTVTGTAFTIPAGMSCTLTVTFTPGTNVPASPTTATLNVFRTGFATATTTLTGFVQSQLTISSSSTDFTTPAGTPLTRSFTITNRSTTPVTSVSCNFTAGGADWTRNNLCTGTLAPSGTCTCDVTFSRATPGSTTAAVEALSTGLSGGFGSANSGTLTGNAQSAAGFIHNCGSDVQASNCTSGAARFSYGNVANGTNGSFYTFVVRNTGSLTSSTITATMAGANPGDFDLGTNTCTTLTGGNTCTIQVRFSPTATGARTAQLNVTAGAATTSIFFSGTGVATTGITVSPNVFDFGAGPSGTALPSQVFTISNGGAATSPAGAPASSAGQFVLSGSTCGTTLAAGTNCQVTVTYTPNAVGLQTANLNAFGVTGAALLRGRGQAAAALALNPTGTTAFGNVPVGTSATAVSFTVSNTGDVAAPAINAIAIATNPAHYTVSSTCNGVVLQPNNGVAGGTDECTFTIAFSPALVGGYGSKPASVTVTAGSGAGMLSSPTRNLSGTGVNPAALGISPTAAIDCVTGDTFALQTTDRTCTNTWTLSNTGDVPATGITFTFANTDFSAVASGSCGTGTLTNGGTCTVTAHYDPQVVGADAGAVLTIASTNGGTVTGTVNGNAVSGLQHTATTPATFTANSVNFGTGIATLASVQQTVTIRNGGGGQNALATGALRYSISGGTAPADFDIINDQCTGRVLNNNTTCTMIIEFVPTMTGSRTATLTVDDGSAERRVAIALTGN